MTYRGGKHNISPHIDTTTETLDVKDNQYLIYLYIQFYNVRFFLKIQWYLVLWILIAFLDLKYSSIIFMIL